MKNDDRSYLVLGIVSVVYLWTVWFVDNAWPEYHWAVTSTIIPAVGTFIAWVILTMFLWGGHGIE